MSEYFVYSLSDPRTLEIRYIGKTVASLSTRLSQHIYAAMHNKWASHVNNWVKSLVNVGHRPIINAISVVSDKHLLEKEEIRLIEYYKARGARLVNLTKGGDGAPGRILCEASLLKMSKSHLGQPGYWTGKKRDAGTCRKISESNKGKKAWNKGIRGGTSWNKGIPMSAESKAKISVSRKGKGCGARAPEVYARISAALKGRPGRKQSDEIRKKISDSMRQYRAKLAATREGVTTIPQGSTAKRLEAQDTQLG